MSPALLLITTSWLAGADAPDVIIQTGHCNGGDCGKRISSSCGCHNDCESSCRRSFRDRMRGWFKSDDCCDSCDDGCEKPTWFERCRSKFRSDDCCDPCHSVRSKHSSCGHGGCGHDCGCDTGCGHGERRGLWSRLKSAFKGECDDCAHDWHYVGPETETKEPEKMPKPKVKPKNEGGDKKGEAILKPMPLAPELAVPPLSDAPKTLPIKKSPY